MYIVNTSHFSNKKKILLLFFFIFLASCKEVFCSNDDDFLLRNNNLNKINIEVKRNCRSAIVIDAINGEILFSHNADRKIFPASLTKMMTAYIVFDAINNGVIGINDKSEYSKILKIKEYNNITIKDLIYNMIVNSSNVVTDILAKEVSFGNVKEFIKKMNNVAKKIGMKNTNFSNTNGLHDENHYSTARDIAKLSIRLVYDFPQYIDFFETTNYIDNNNNYNTKTTRIQDNAIDIGGSKTGYVNASGYNLVAWKRKNNNSDKKNHIFVVLTGANDTEKRDELVIKLINFYSDTNNSFIKRTINTTQQEEMTKKIFNFIGIDYNKYKTPIPVKRQKNITHNIHIYNNFKS